MCFVSTLTRERFTFSTPAIQIDFDHAAFATALSELNARWMVSYRELPPAFDTLDDIVILEKRTNNAMQQPGQGRKDAVETLVCNFDPETDAETTIVEQSQKQLGDY